MDLILRGGRVFMPSGVVPADVRIAGGAVVEIGDVSGSAPEIDMTGSTIFPGFVEAHAHFREPGFCWKETVRTGSMAAARGGYTDVVTMPNLNPVPDSPQRLRAQLGIIDKNAAVNVHPLGAITVGLKGESLSDMAGLAPLVPGYTDDGRGVQGEKMMREAMNAAKRLGKVIAAHCEDDALRAGGCVHAGAFARERGLPGISSESEWRQIERDIRLARETGCAYHAMHVSTKEGVELIRRAKADGLDVTCETAPHYLLLDEGMLLDEGRFKMNPPIRERADREALIAGISDGTIDMIATDHAPHAQAEKEGGLRGSVMGVVGLETAFPLMYTHFVKSGILPLNRLMELMGRNPAARYGIPWGLRAGGPANLTAFDLNAEYEIDPSAFLSMGRSTPFEGWRVFGRCRLTLCGGEIAYREEER